MDIVLNSRHCELTDRFRSHVKEKLARLEKHDHRVIRVEVEVDKERNPRQANRAVRVELTAFPKGPGGGAEAAAEDKSPALALGSAGVVGPVPRASARRRVRRGRPPPPRVGKALADPEPGLNGVEPSPEDQDEARQVGRITVPG